MYAFDVRIPKSGFFKFPCVVSSNFQQVKSQFSDQSVPYRVCSFRLVTIRKE